MRLGYQYFRLLIFLLHAITSVWFLWAAFTTNCGASLVTVSFFESVAILDGSWGGYNYDNHEVAMPPVSLLGSSSSSSSSLGWWSSSSSAMMMAARTDFGPDPPRFSIAFLTSNQTPYEPGCVYPPTMRENHMASWDGQGGINNNNGSSSGSGGGNNNYYYSENRSWYLCRALEPGPANLMDMQEDVRSFIVGSAWNILMVMVMFEWITSSYALLYLQEPALVLRYIPMPPGFHPAPTLATVWNLVLLCVMWGARNALLLPDNNLFLFSALLLTTMVFQNYLARPGTPPILLAGGLVPVAQAPNDEEEEVGDTSIGASSAVGGGMVVATTTPHGGRARGALGGGGGGGGGLMLMNTRNLFVKTDALSSSSAYQRKGRANGGSGGRTSSLLGGRAGGGGVGGPTMFGTGANGMGGGGGIMGGGGGGEPPPLLLPSCVCKPYFYGDPSPQVAVHSPFYAYLLDEGGEGVAARMMEYTTTAPLLLVGLLLCYPGAALTWAFQVLFLGLMVCNALGIVLHYVVLLLRTCAPHDRDKLRSAGFLVLAASWLSFAAGFAVYLNEASHFMAHGSDGGSGAPAWVVVLMWSLTVMYSAFGFVITWFYLPRLLYPDPTAAATQQQGTAEGKDPWLRTFDWVIVCLDILSVAAKLAVAWTVYTKGSVVNCAASAAASAVC